MTKNNALLDGLKKEDKVVVYRCWSAPTMVKGTVVEASQRKVMVSFEGKLVIFSKATGREYAKSGEKSEMRLLTVPCLGGMRLATWEDLDGQGPLPLRMDSLVEIGEVTNRAELLDELRMGLGVSEIEESWLVVGSVIGGEFYAARTLESAGIPTGSLDGDGFALGRLFRVLGTVAEVLHER